jgi:hypothetical protein
MKAQVASSSRVWKDFICRELKRRAAWGHAGAPETGGCMGQVGDWVFIVFLLPEGRDVSQMQTEVSWKEVSTFGTFKTSSQ